MLWLLLLLLSALTSLVEEPVEKRRVMDTEAAGREYGMWMEQAEFCQT
jgi:hypothetical protein